MQRKPPGVTYESWVDRQIRVAQERGAFDDLPGAGKPIPDLEKRRTGVEWAVDWARREGADLTAVLPPSLSLRRERELGTGGLLQLEGFGDDVVALENTGQGERTLVLANLGAEPVTLPEGEVLVVSGELDADGRLPLDTAAWVRLAG